MIRKYFDVLDMHSFIRDVDWHFDQGGASGDITLHVCESIAGLRSYVSHHNNPQLL